MKLKPRDIVILSTMICGDPPYKKIFPYRKTENLAVFFQKLGFDYTYDGTLFRMNWVESVLKNLNEKADIEGDSLCPEINTVIREALNSDDYTNLRFTDFDKAKKLMEKMLKEYQLTLNEILNPGIEIKKVRNSTKSFSTKSEEQSLRIYPQVFTIPTKKINNNLVSVMMPLSQEFQEVYNSIKQSCKDAHMDCQRADDIWKNSVIIQDIFELIFTSKIVIADFTKRNPNVFYEVGIAHTLGKYVIPIAQSMDDIPFDLHHHRVLLYHDNSEGRCELQKVLYSRIMTINEEFQKD